MAVATVSAALNGTGTVSEATRERIRQVSQQMNYEPNLAAKLLKQKNTRDIGLIISDIPERIFGSGYFQPMIANFIRQCEVEGIRCQIEYHDPVTHADTVPSMVTNGFAGGILHGGNISRGLRAWLRQNPEFPFVAFEEEHTYQIKSRYDLAFYQAIQYLVALGHRRFGLLAGPDKYSLQHQIRSGFLRAMEDFGLTYRPEEWTIDLSMEKDQETVAQAVEWGRTLFRRREYPSALICCDGRAAKGLLYAATESGIRIPEQLSLLACSSQIESEQTYPAISSIAWNAPEAILKGFYMLKTLIDRRTLSERVVCIEPTTTIRASTAKAPESHYAQL